MIGAEKVCVFCGMLFTIKTEGYEDMCRRCIADDQNEAVGFAGAAIPEVNNNRDWLKDIENNAGRFAVYNSLRRGDKFRAFYGEGKKASVFIVDAIDKRGFIDVQPSKVDEYIILAIPFEDIVSIERG